MDTPMRVCYRISGASPRGRLNTGMTVALVRALVTLALVAFLRSAPAHGQVAHAEAAAWSPWSLTQSEIQATGAVRLSEILRAMPVVETWSPDRYTLRFLGSGLGGMHPVAPAIFLDGVAIPAHVLDRVLTESLPASPGDLLSVTWIPGLNSMPGARLAEGRVLLETPMLSGWNAAGSMALINETGDPGPAKHVDARLTNVDRSGPATWLRLGWGNGRWMVQSGLQTDLHHLTDDRISGRVRQTYAEDAQPIVTQFSPFARLRFQGHRWTGHLLAGQSRRKGFTYHEAAGWEWPSRLTRSWMVGQLRADLDPVRIRLDVDASEVMTGNRPSYITLPSPVTLAQSAVRLRLERSWGGIDWSGGMALRSSRISQGGHGRSLLLPSIHGKMARSSGSWLATVSAEILRIPSEASRRATLSSFSEGSLRYRDDNGWLQLALQYAAGRFPEPGQLSEWAEAGVDLGDWMSLPPFGGSGTLPRSLDLGATANRSLTRHWSGWVDGRIRWMGGHLMPDRIIDQRFGIGPLLPFWSWSAPHGGWLFSRSVGMEWRAESGIALRSFLQFYHVSSEGDDVFFRHQTGFPRHRFGVSASDEWAGGVSWFLRLGYRSRWTWPEYREPARTTVPPHIVVDASVGKTLFSGYGKAVVALINLPDRPLGIHPAGVQEQLAIRLTLAFSSDRFVRNQHGTN